MGPLFKITVKKINMNSTIFLFLQTVKTNIKRTLNILTIFKDEEHNNCSFSPLRIKTSLIEVIVIVTQPCPTLCYSRTVAHQVPLLMEFYRREYWSGQPFPSPGDLPDSGTEPHILYCLSHQGGLRSLCRFSTSVVIFTELHSPTKQAQPVLYMYYLI